MVVFLTSPSSAFLAVVFLAVVFLAGASALTSSTTGSSTFTSSTTATGATDLTATSSFFESFAFLFAALFACKMFFEVAESIIANALDKATFASSNLFSLIRRSTFLISVLTAERIALFCSVFLLITKTLFLRI